MKQVGCYSLIGDKGCATRKHKHTEYIHLIIIHKNIFGVAIDIYNELQLRPQVVMTVTSKTILHILNKIIEFIFPSATGYFVFNLPSICLPTLS